MRLIDVRRLTGPNHLSRAPLVLAELELDAAERVEDAVRAYCTQLGVMRGAVGMSAEVDVLVRPHHGGVVIAYEAPLDIMLACTEMSEWAVLSLTEGMPFEPRRTEIAAMLVTDASPPMMAIAAEAGRRKLPFLWDDDAISVGLGARSITWARKEIPEVAAVPWDTLGTIPVVLITGTNGKTTTSRLLARVAREAGRRVGLTSSDAVTVNGEVLEEGDWTGPAAARVVLRRTDVDFAVLETARGGILRRGLALDDVDCAIITNVSEDHVGGYGIDDLDAMTEVKGVVAHAARTVILNARDPKLVALASRLRAKVVFFTYSPDVTEVNGVPLAEIPITFGGAAAYNVENILGVVAAARELGLPDDAVARALRGFRSEDNPGRGELVSRDGVRVLLDFGHNAEGIRGLLALVASLRRPGERITVVAGAAGDRLTRDIEEMARVIASARPDRVLARDLVSYMRGRAPGEVPAIFARVLGAHGLPVVTHESEVAALASIFDGERAPGGELVVVLVHLDREAVQAFLASRE